MEFQRQFNPEKGGSGMLVLSRRQQESVMIGTPDGGSSLCKVTVLEIKGGRVKLAFEVDRGVPVHRFELWQRIGSDGKQRDTGIDRPAGQMIVAHPENDH